VQHALIAVMVTLVIATAVLPSIRPLKPAARR
jgi:hypothetical protein